MKLAIDTAAGTLTREDGTTMPLYSTEGFDILSDLWVKVGWNQKYVYGFSWMGRPVIQLPEDMIRVQEVIWATKPDVIIETGVAHGGSLIFYASLFEAMGKGRVIGVDIEIRPHNFKAMTEHPLFRRITLVEGSSTDENIVAKVRSLVAPGERVMVLLDSNHTYAHVAAELEAYAPFVTPGCYIVSTDGVMRIAHDVPRAGKDWLTDNPANAAEDFAKKHPEFVLEQPPRAFDETPIKPGDKGLPNNVTHWPSAYLRRV